MGRGDMIRIENGEKGGLVICPYYELKELLRDLGRILPPRCPACNGSGEVTFPTEEGQDEGSTCPVCEGMRVAV